MSSHGSFLFEVGSVLTEYQLDQLMEVAHKDCCWGGPHLRRSYWLKPSKWPCGVSADDPPTGQKIKKFFFGFTRFHFATRCKKHSHGGDQPGCGGGAYRGSPKKLQIPRMDLQKGEKSKLMEKAPKKKNQEKSKEDTSKWKGLVLLPYVQGVSECAHRILLKHKVEYRLENRAIFATTQFTFKVAPGTLCTLWWRKLANCWKWTHLHAYNY